MQTAIRVEETHVEALKQLATRLGLFQTRGVGVGTVPSVSAVVRLLAELSGENEFVELVERLKQQKGNNHVEL